MAQISKSHFLPILVCVFPRCNLRDQAIDSEEVVTPLMLDGTYLSRNFLREKTHASSPSTGGKTHEKTSVIQTRR